MRAQRSRQQQQVRQSNPHRRFGKSPDLNARIADLLDVRLNSLHSAFKTSNAVPCQVSKSDASICVCRKLWRRRLQMMHFTGRHDCTLRVRSRSSDLLNPSRAPNSKTIPARARSPPMQTAAMMSDVKVKGSGAMKARLGVRTKSFRPSLLKRLPCAFVRFVQDHRTSSRRSLLAKPHRHRISRMAVSDKVAASSSVPTNQLDTLGRFAPSRLLNFAIRHWLH